MSYSSLNSELQDLFIDAASKGDLKEVEELLRKAGNGDEKREVDINGRDATGYSALFYACVGRHVKVALKIINHLGIDLNVKDRDGCIALFWAVHKGLPRVVSAMLDASDTNSSVTPLQVNAQHQRNGFTALHQAVKNGRLDIVKLLTQYPSTDLFVKDKGGRTALDLAEGNRQIRSYLEKLMFPDTNKNEDPPSNGGGNPLRASLKNRRPAPGNQPPMTLRASPKKDRPAAGNQPPKVIGIGVTNPDSLNRSVSHPESVVGMEQQPQQHGQSNIRNTAGFHPSIQPLHIPMFTSVMDPTPGAGDPNMYYVMRDEFEALQLQCAALQSQIQAVQSKNFALEAQNLAQEAQLKLVMGKVNMLLRMQQKQQQQNLQSQLQNPQSQQTHSWNEP